MQQSKLTSIKNIFWAVGVIVCLAALVIGFLISMFRRNPREKDAFNINIGSNISSEENDSLHAIGSGSGNERGNLAILSETQDGGADYLSRITYLVDSTFIGLRSKGIVDETKVWGTVSGSMPMATLGTVPIKFPNDGSEISAASAAMVARPDILMIGIGTDGLMSVDEETFIGNYNALIREIQSASPDTIIVCMGLCSISEYYDGADGLTISAVSDGNDWIQKVCRDTGVYFIDVSENMGDGSGGLLSRYVESNQKSLNKTGLTEILYYIQTHMVQ